MRYLCGNVWFGGMTALICLSFLGCPDRDDPPDDEPVWTDPLPTADYFPLAVGNVWHWELVVVSTTGQEAHVPVSLAITERLTRGGLDVWHIELAAPWYVMLPLRWLLDGADNGYVVCTGDAFYFTSDSALLAQLPDVSSFDKLPIETDLRPRTVATEWDDEPFYVRYAHGALADFLPATAQSVYFGVDASAFTDVVATSTSDDGVNWRSSRMVLARGLGPVFCTTDFGYLYLQGVEQAQPSQQDL